jgi:zinc D-Ala-D-Ala dipeptidase
LRQYSGGHRIGALLKKIPNASGLHRPIPLLRAVDGWEDIPINECGDPLIRVADLEPYRVVQISVYFSRGFPSANRDLYVRNRVGDLLVAAASQLPATLNLAVFDAWRPAALQQEIFADYLRELRKKTPNVPDNQLLEQTKRYVSLPATDPRHPAPHLTGGAVDVALCDEARRIVAMATEFDHFGPESATRYLEQMEERGDLQDDLVALDNRRLLFNIMINVGFTNYSEEWWHFDYGNQFWARVRNAAAMYGPANPYRLL